MGVILFEMLTGQPPFSGKDDFELIEAHLNDDAPRLREVDHTLPDSLDDVITRALHKYQDERFANAEEMAMAIEVAAQELPE